jgi:hypothetical protein
MEVLHPRCCGLDVHKETVVACVRRVIDGKTVKEVLSSRNAKIDAAGRSGSLSPSFPLTCNAVRRDAKSLEQRRGTRSRKVGLRQGTTWVLPADH